MPAGRSQMCRTSNVETCTNWVRATGVSMLRHSLCSLLWVFKHTVQGKSVPIESVRHLTAMSCKLSHRAPL
jgi:hypothetical protein